jgi:hypothetical protein
MLKASLPSAHLTVRVIDLESFDLNGTRHAAYKIEWREKCEAAGEAQRGGRLEHAKSGMTCVKRLNEIVYHREKLCGELPNLLVPPVPSLPADPSANALQSHMVAMEAYLNELLSNPLTGCSFHTFTYYLPTLPSGKRTYLALCDTTSYATSSAPINPKAPVEGGTSALPSASSSLNSASSYLEHRSRALPGQESGPEIQPEKHWKELDASGFSPLHSLLPHGRSSVGVTGYVEGVPLERSQDKILFLVTITHQLKESRSYDNTVRTLQKRFKQFRALHTSLSLLPSFAAVSFFTPTKQILVKTGEEVKAAEDESSAEVTTVGRSKVRY